MASKDSDKTERSRLVSEALDFNTRSQDEFTTPQQHPVSSAASMPQKYFKAGQLLGGKYTVIDVLGTGKAGVVYKVLTALQDIIIHTVVLGIACNTLCLLPLAV